MPEVRRIVDITDEAQLQRLLQHVPEWVKDPGLERAGWLNAIMARAWPHVSHVAVDLFKTYVWPFVKEKFVECGMSVKFCSMSLGSFPPTFDSVKAVETLDDECIIETTLTFATNASLISEVGIGGFVTVVQLSEVHATGVCRLTFAPLTAQFPCFAGIHISLMDMPDVDAKVTALGGTDLLVIPRVKPMALGAMQGILAEWLLWPNRFLLPLQHEALAGTRRAVGTVALKIIRARGLVYSGIGLPAPYVKVHMDENRTARSTPKEGTCNPHWGEHLMLAVDDPQQDQLHFRVMDYDAVFRDSLLGTASLAIKSLPPGQTKKLVLDLQSKNRLVKPKPKSIGVLELEATFRTFQMHPDPLESPPISTDQRAATPLPMKASGGEGSGLLEVFVRKGMNLEPYKDGNIRTFCKIFIGSDVRKTRVVQHMTNPQWNEEFEFLFDSPPISSKMRVEIWHHEDAITILSTTKRLLGYVEVRLKDVVENQRIRDIFQLNSAKQGQLLLEMVWLRH